MRSTVKMRGNTPEGKERAAKMAALAESGVNLADVARQFGLSRERVRQILLQHGCTTYLEANAALRQRNLEERDVEIARLLTNNSGVTHAEVARTLGVGRSTITHSVGRTGAVSEFHAESRRIDAEIYEAYARGLPWVEIAAQFDLPTYEYNGPKTCVGGIVRARRHAKRNGLPWPIPHVHRTQKKE
jgi:transposase-like protein